MDFPRQIAKRFFLGTEPKDRTLRPRIEIHYCRQCNWMLRSAWYAQELLSTFSEEIGEVALRPGTGGVFQIHCDQALIWDRKQMDGFPEIKQLKQLIRDQVAPDRELGHIDRKPSQP